MLPLVGIDGRTGSDEALPVGDLPLIAITHDGPLIAARRRRRVRAKDIVAASASARWLDPAHEVAPGDAGDSSSSRVVLRMLLDP